MYTLGAVPLPTSESRNNSRALQTKWYCTCQSSVLLVPVALLSINGPICHEALIPTGHHLSLCISWRNLCLQYDLSEGLRIFCYMPIWQLLGVAQRARYRRTLLGVIRVPSDRGVWKKQLCQKGVYNIADSGLVDGVRIWRSAYHQVVTFQFLIGWLLADIEWSLTDLQHVALSVWNLCIFSMAALAFLLYHNEYGMHFSGSVYRSIILEGL